MRAAVASAGACSCVQGAGTWRLGRAHARLPPGELLPGVPALPAPLWVMPCGCPIVDNTLLQEGGGHQPGWHGCALRNARPSLSVWPASAAEHDRVQTSLLAASSPCAARRPRRSRRSAALTTCPARRSAAETPRRCRARPVGRAGGRHGQGPTFMPPPPMHATAERLGTRTACNAAAEWAHQTPHLACGQPSPARPAHEGHAMPPPPHLDGAEDAAQRAAVDLHGRPLLAPQVLLRRVDGVAGSSVNAQPVRGLRVGKHPTAPQCQLGKRKKGKKASRAPPRTLMSFSTAVSLACCAAAVPLSPALCWPSSIRLMACQGGRQGSSCRMGLAAG